MGDTYLTAILGKATVFIRNRNLAVMSEHAVALIGTGANPDDADLSGFAMAYQHADAYEAIDDVEIVACADIVRE